MIDAERSSVAVRAALAGPYAFLTEELGFVPVGGIQVRENRPAADVWQDLERDGVTVSVVTGGDSVPDPDQPCRVLVRLASTGG